MQDFGTPKKILQLQIVLISLSLYVTITCQKGTQKSKLWHFDLTFFWWESSKPWKFNPTLKHWRSSLCQIHQSDVSWSHNPRYLCQGPWLPTSFLFRWSIVQLHHPQWIICTSWAHPKVVVSEVLPAPGALGIWK